MQNYRTPPAERAPRITLARGFEQAFRWGLPPALTIALLWLTGDGTATPAQAFLALLLLQATWGSWVSWKAKPARERDFPLFTAVAAGYFLTFGFPAFWNSHALWRDLVSDQATTRAVALAVVGVAALWCGMRLDLCCRLRRAPTLGLKDTPTSPTYVAAVMLLGAGLKYVPSLAYVFGSASRQVFMIAAATLPLVGYAILLRRQLMRPVPMHERLLLVLFVVFTFFLGLASGWVGSGALVLIITGYVLIDTRHRVPKLVIALALLYVFFLQPAKQQFRTAYWGGASQSGAAERAADWITLSRQAWTNSLHSTTPGAWRDLIYSSMSRGSLLPQTANVMDITPGIVPYQGARMYQYLVVALIPRVVWPDKPSVNESNRFYQVTYGMTAERDLDGVSISVGILTEAYISYGWTGTIALMLLVGIFLNAVNIVLLGRDSGVLMKAIGIALLPMFGSADAQMAQFLGGFLQQILLVIVVMLPILRVERRREIPRGAAAGPRGLRFRAPVMRPGARPTQSTS